MGYLLGLKEYLDAEYEKSVFTEAIGSQKPWELHIHGKGIVRARVLEDLAYDVKLDIEGEGEVELPKLQIKLMYPAELSKAVGKLVKPDKKVKGLGLEPMLMHVDRQFVKNKTLFPLMKGREVVFFTLVGGEVVRGLVAGFTRYDITVSLKGGIPVTILRHGLHDVRDKKGRCFLKSYQDRHRDWEKSEIFVSE